MPGFDYSNARLRAMKGRLLDASVYRDLVHLPTVDSFLASLRETPYRRSLEEAVIRPGTLESAYRVLQLDLARLLKRVVGFLDGKDRELVELALRKIEVDNLRAILRGLGRGIPAVAITPALIPTPGLPLPLLHELSRASGPRDAVNRMASLGVKYAQPLVSHQAETGRRLSASMEEALVRWHFERLLAELDEMGSRAAPVREAVRLELDAANVGTVMRRVGEADATEPAEGERTGDPFIEGGSLPGSMLAEVAQAESYQQAVQRLAAASLGRQLLEELEAAVEIGPASVDRALWRLQVRQRKRMMIVDALGPGVFLGYLALKQTEYRNLRWIVGSIEAGLEADEILDEVEILL